MAKVSTVELRSQKKEELTNKLKELKKELASARVQKASKAQKGSDIGTLRKDIARVLTVITEKQRQNLKALYKNKKYVPLDLRQKKTRAIRRQLTSEQQNKLTERQLKKQRHFPMRKYAVLA